MKFERIWWCDELVAGLGDALGGDEIAIRADIDASRACAWRFGGGVAYVVARIAESAQRRELVIMAAAGERLREITPVLYRIGQQAQCQRIRWHTKRPALARLVGRDFKVQALEHIFAVEIEQ